MGAGEECKKKCDSNDRIIKSFHRFLSEFYESNLVAISQLGNQLHVYVNELSVLRFIVFNSKKVHGAIRSGYIFYNQIEWKNLFALKKNLFQ